MKIIDFHHHKSFTLIELLIVIVIIGILATALIPRLTGMQSKARDTQRIADLKQIQTALEMYASENNGNYPLGVPNVIGYRGICDYFNSGGLLTASGPNGWIPDLAPKYISVLPSDPKPKGANGCYIYRSDGKEYIIMAYLTVEGKLINEFVRPTFPTQKTFAIYSAGGIGW